MTRAALLASCVCALACSSSDDDAGDELPDFGGRGGSSNGDAGRSADAGSTAGGAGRSGAGGSIASAGTGSAGSGPRAGAGGAGTQSGTGGDSGGGAGRSGTGGAGGRSSAGAGGQPAGDQCIVARRLDRCCAEYEAVLRSALAGDECLNEEPGPAPDSMRAQRCFEQSPDNCALVLCAPLPPPSRVASSDGAGGGCHFVDECITPDDCAIVVHSSACCECASSMPAVLLETDPCFLPEGESPPQGCPLCETPVPCGQCVPPPEFATCVIGDALNRCE